MLLGDSLTGGWGGLAACTDRALSVLPAAPACVWLFGAVRVPSRSKRSVSQGCAGVHPLPAHRPRRARPRPPCWIQTCSCCQRRGDEVQEQINGGTWPWQPCSWAGSSSGSSQYEPGWEGRSPPLQQLCSSVCLSPLPKAVRAPVSWRRQSQALAIFIFHRQSCFFWVPSPRPVAVG